MNNNTYGEASLFLTPGKDFYSTNKIDKKILNDEESLDLLNSNANSFTTNING